MEKNRAVFRTGWKTGDIFKDTVILDTIYKGKKMNAVYTAEIGYQYTIRNVVYPDGTGFSEQAIGRMARRSLIKKGDPIIWILLKMKEHGSIPG